MAGYLTPEKLDTYAIVGAKNILASNFLKLLPNCSFEENPVGCFRALMVELLNENYLTPLVNRHPNLRPDIETFLEKRKDGTVDLGLYAELYSNALKVYAEDAASNLGDIEFSIMLAAIFGTCFTDEDHEQGKNMIFSPIEIWDGEILGISNLLLPCALWGCDYENYRELLSAQYYELKAQGFGEEKDTSTLNQDTQKTQPQKEDLIKQAEENIDHYKEKFQFITDVNEQIQRNMDALDSRVDIGKKYCSYYMEIEKYYIDPLYRISFITFCLDAQPETLLKTKGFVPVDYFLAQTEIFLQSLDNLDNRIRLIRTMAKRAQSLAFWEMLQMSSDGDFDISTYGWEQVCEYIYNHAEKWGWDGYLEDATKWDYIPSSLMKSREEAKKENSVPSPVPSNSDKSTGGCYIATAVYGSYNCPEVWTLRRFRDFSLANTWYGQMFIRLYYALSPSLVKWFGDTRCFQRFWRARLDRLVAYLRTKGFDDTPYQDKA